MQNINEFLPRIFTVIDKGLRHSDYQRTVDVAEKAYAFKTGDGLEKWLEPFTLSETAEEFEASLKVTRLTAPIVTKSICGVWNKIPRSRNNRVLEYDGDTNEVKKQALEDRLDVFWGDNGNADQWVDVRFWELNSVDPNTWLVTEISDFAAGEYAKPYPFEVPAANAVDFLIKEDELQFLNARQTFTLKTDNNGGTKVGERFTIYAQDQTFTVTEIYTPDWNALHPDKIVQPRKTQTYQYDAYQDTDFPNGGGFLYSENRVFLVQFLLPHNLGFVPARRVGFIRDDTTQGNTFVCLFDAAYPVLEGAMVTERHMALTVANVVFPDVSEFMPPCDAQGCYRGELPGGSKCGTCNGTGHKTVLSAARRRQLPMPQTAADVVMPLSEMVSYKGPETAILDWMYTFVKNLQDRAVEAVFQSDVFSSKDVVVTATEKNISLQNVYDQLFAASQVVAVFWSHVVWTVAGFTDSIEGLKAEKIYNRDFRFKALIDIVAELEGAQRANAGPLVIRPLMRQIIEIVNDGDRAAINQYDLLEQLNPFAGKSDADIAAARVSPYIPERLKVRFENLTYIVDKIVADLGDKLAKGITIEKLEAMADAEVAKIMAEVAQDKPMLTNFVTN